MGWASRKLSHSINSGIMTMMTLTAATMANIVHAHRSILEKENEKVEFRLMEANAVIIRSGKDSHPVPRACKAAIQQVWRRLLTASLKDLHNFALGRVASLVGVLPVDVGIFERDAEFLLYSLNARPLARFRIEM